MAVFTSLKQNFIAYRSSKVSPSRLHFEIYHSCDNQALVGCIPIHTIAVQLGQKLVSRLIIFLSIAIPYIIFKSL